jgi:hypothetical protein
MRVQGGFGVVAAWLALVVADGAGAADLPKPSAG